MIGVNHTSIYIMFFMCLGNLNARCTPIFVKITLILHLLMFCRIRRKIKQSDGRNQVKRKSVASLRRCGSPLQRRRLTAAKGMMRTRCNLGFATTKTTTCHNEKKDMEMPPSSSPR